MFSALVVTLREGVEAALIVGITLVYLSKIGRPDLRRTVYYALVAALLGSIAGAVALSYAPINQDKVEGWVMLVAAVFVVSMVIFMMRTARKLKGEIENKVGSLAGAGSQWGLFAFVFLMVFREGIETVAILAGVSLNSTELMSFLGTLLGVALAVVFGVMFVKGSVRIDLRKFFKVTTVILFFVAAQLMISGLHELSESGVLPSSKREMALIGPIARNDYFFPRHHAGAGGADGAAGISPPQACKPRSCPPPKPKNASSNGQPERERLWAVLVCVTAFVFITTITAEVIYAEGPPPLSQATEITFTNGKVAISDQGPAAGRTAALRRQRKRHAGPLSALSQARRQNCFSL